MRQISTFFFSLLLSLVFGLSALAQPSNRAASTVIVDALNQLPAQNQDLYKRLMTDLATTGEEGVDLLITMLQKHDASRPKVEYALSGYAAFASAMNTKDAKNLLISKFNAVIDNIDSQLSGDNAKDIAEKPLLVGDKEFLLRQLKVLGVVRAPVEVAEYVPVKDLEKALQNATKVAKKDPTYANNALRYSALSNLIKAVGSKEGAAQQLFIDAILDSDKEYRFTALNAVPQVSAEQLANINKVFKTASPEIQIDLLSWMKNLNLDNSAVVAELLSSDNKELKTAAAKTLAAIGNKDYIAPIAALLANKEDAALAESCLKTFKGDVITPALAVLNQASSDEAKTAVINLISARKATGSKDVIKSALKGATAPAAFAALRNVVEAADQDELFSLLESADPKYTEDVQSAIMSALTKMSKSKKFNLFSERQAASSKKELYWPLVLKTANYFQLLDICGNFAKTGASDELRDASFSAYMANISRKISGEQAMIMLRNAMDFARNDKQKNQILDRVAVTNTLEGILFAGKFIEEPALQQSAAQAVRKNALSNVKFNTPEVVALLKRAAQVINNPDAQYEITAINDHLDKLAKQGETASAEKVSASPEEIKEGFKVLFDGENLDEWQGNKLDYVVADGLIHVAPTGQGFGNLYTNEEYSDFVLRFEFKLTPGANNGIGIRAEMGKDAAYYGMEIQVLDHFNEIYQPGLRDYQHHGSVYGIIPTKDKNQLKPLGEWNVEEIYAKGNYIRVTLNGVVITEGDIKEATKNGTHDHLEHPGLFNKSGYIGFLGHGSELWYRNVRIKRL